MTDVFTEACRQCWHFSVLFWGNSSVTIDRETTSAILRSNIFLLIFLGALQLDLKVMKSKLCCSKYRTDFQSPEPCITLKLTQATVPFQQGFPNSVGVAAAVDSSLLVCTRPVTQRRWCASVPSSPFSKQNPLLMEPWTAAPLIPTGYSHLPQLGSAAFPMLLQYLHKYSLFTYYITQGLLSTAQSQFGIIKHLFSLLSFHT